MRKLKRKWLISIGVLILAASYFHFHKKNAPTSFTEEPTYVETAKVKEETIPIDVQAVGTLVAAHNINITTESSGQVAKILFKDGTYVAKDTPLIQLDDAVFKSKYQSAQAELKLSEKTYERLSSLVKPGVISKQDLEKAAADLAGKKAQANEAQVLWEKMQIKAPFAGVVGKCLVSPGDFITPGQALVTLTDRQHLRVEYTLSAKYFGLIKLGQAINLTTSSFPNKLFQGSVSFISPTINALNRTVSLYADVPNEKDQLTAGLFVNVQHSLGKQEKTLLIPATSLMATIDGQEVYRVIKNKVQTTPIKIGLRTLNKVEVVEGLKAGETVVISGQQKLRDGATITDKA